jgi:hypothetical protein
MAPSGLVNQIWPPAGAVRRREVRHLVGVGLLEGRARHGI